MIMIKSNKRLSFITLSFIAMIIILLVIIISHKMLKIRIDEKSLSLQNLADDERYDTGIDGLDENFFKSDELAIGLFWTNKIEKENGSYKKILNRDIGLYVTNDGKKFTYIGETGISGRDPNVMYKNGVFYMATTKGGSTNGNIVFNVFKSTDLVNWTNGINYEYRYEPAKIPNNKYGMPCNTWSPKFFVDGDDMYILISLQRFNEDGSTVYYIKGDKNSLNDNGLAYVEENEKIYYEKTDGTKQEIDTNKGILIKESAILDEQGEALYDENNKVKTKKEYVLDTNDKIINIQCPWYEPNYSIFDTYISKIDIGTDSEQKDINYQNLRFGEFKKVNFKDRPLNETHSMLGGYIIKSNSNKYVMYTKTDPFGTVQRWISDTIDGEWIKADDRFYALTSNATDSSSTNSVVCNKKETYNGDTVFKKHYEGSFFSNFGNDTIFYSDHYIINSTDEVGENPTADNVRAVSGIYYSVVKNNLDQSNFEVTDLGTIEHIRYSDFIKLSISNIEMRPSISENNTIRNGSVVKIGDEARDILKEACQFKISEDRRISVDENNFTVVLKSNRALMLPEGWKYVTAEDIDENTKKIYYKYNISIPYSKDEIYICKTYKKILGMIK